MLEIRCSGLSRVIHCPGSVGFIDLPEQEEGDPAREGTAAAEYLEGLLTGKPLGTHASNGVYFDNDIRFYVGQVAARLWEKSKGQINCETEVSWKIDDVALVKGRYDASYVEGDTLHVVDLKYGWRLIEPQFNWQLIGYAIGELFRRGDSTINRIVMTIEQPRPHHSDGQTRSWTISTQELQSYYVKAHEIIVGIAKHGIMPLKTGSHCRYCPALGSCPAASRQFFAALDETMGEWKQDDITNEEIRRQFGLIDKIEEIIKIRKQSLKDLAVFRVKQGQVIPGYALEVTYGHRQWSSGASPDAILALTGKDVTEKSLMSPAKAERLGISKAILDALTKRPVVGQNLVAVDANKLGEKYFGKPE